MTDSVQDDEDLLAASIINSRAAVRAGDIIIPFKSVRRTIPAVYQASESGQHFVLGFEFPKSTIGGKGSFVFLDQNQGSLQVGDTVKLFQDVRRAALSADAADLPERKKYIGDAYGCSR